MSNSQQLQAQEKQILEHVLREDVNFKRVNDKTYRYKFTDGRESFVVEISWGPNYPNEKPTFNLGLPENQHLFPSVKRNILLILDSEADMWLGEPMTFSLLTCIFSELPNILADQTDEQWIAPEDETEEEETEAEQSEEDGGFEGELKEQQLDDEEFEVDEGEEIEGEEGEPEEITDNDLFVLGFLLRLLRTWRQNEEEEAQDQSN